MAASISCPEPFDLTPTDPGWPSALAELSTPPTSLRVHGTIPPWQRAVCIVGTRRADPEGLRFAQGLARDLADAGCVIVSGGAMGIDAAAHAGALAAGAPTVAVLASGISPAYPRPHRDLFARIAAAGLLLSEQPDGTPVHGYLFLRRNRLVAALSRVTIVVQAPERSGALSTARHAVELGRPVLSVPAAPWDLRGRGSLMLLRAGAAPCLDAGDVLRAMSDAPPNSVTGSSQTRPTPSLVLPPKPKSRAKATLVDAELDADAQLVLAALGSTPRSADSLSRDLDLPAARISRALFSLMLAGYADERFGSYVALRL